MVKTIQQTVRESLKRALLEDFVDKMAGKAVKRIKSFTVPECKNKGNKIKYKTDNKKRKSKGKKIIIKQQKLLRIADREKHGWEVMKCYLSDDLPSDSKDKKELSRTRREAAASKKKREANEPECPLSLPEKFLKSLAKHITDTAVIGVTQNHTKSVLPVDKKDICNVSAQTEETETTINFSRDWEISDKTEDISVREKLKEK